jgi:hypothetical protein
VRLHTEIEPEHRELPDHIELAVRIAGMKMWDAQRAQEAAAYNSGAVRHRIELSATRRIACELYAYARYLMGIDTYWETLPHVCTKQRMDYILEREQK